MIAFLIIQILLNALIGVLLYFLHERVENMSKNQAIMVEWFDTVKQNEEQLLTDFNKLRNECKAFEKDNRKK